MEPRKIARRKSVEGIDEQLDKDWADVRQWIEELQNDWSERRRMAETKQEDDG